MNTATELLMDGELRHTRDAHGVHVLTLHSPATFNALGESMLAALQHAMGKQLFYQQAEMGMEAAYQLAGQTRACNMVRPVMQEGVQAFIDKRSPAWRT